MVKIFSKLNGVGFGAGDGIQARVLQEQKDLKLSRQF